MDVDRETRLLSRRRALAGLGGGTVGLLAGCTGTSNGDGGDGDTGGSDGDGSDGDDGSDGGGSGGEGPTPRAQRLSPPVKGDPDAPVTLAVFEDYACPHCADYNVEGFPELDEAYVASGDIRYEHRDLPIPVADPGSFQAANAARGVQDRHGDEAFWEYAAVLFERSGDITSQAPDLFGTIADEQGYDGEEIREAAVERVYEATVQGDREEAVDIGAEATPAFVLDGEIVASGFGSETVDAVSAAIEEALSETG